MACGLREAKFTAKLKLGGYEVRLAYPPDTYRATNVPATIQHAGGTTQATVNQRAKLKDGKPTLLGTFQFKGVGTVSLKNSGTDGHVILDAVQFLSK